MKKFLSIFLILIISMSAVSCGFGSNNNNDETKPPYVNKDYTYVGTQTVNDIKANGDGARLLEKYFTDAPLNTDIKEALSQYSTTDKATAEFAELHENADDISVLPAYGAYLENTSLAVCIFSKNNEPIGTRTVNVTNTNGSLSISEFIGDNDIFPEENDPTEEIKDRKLPADDTCFETLKNCLASHPDFKIIGFVYGFMGGSDLCPFGYKNNNKYLSFYGVSIEEGRLGLYGSYRDIWDFYFVEPFSTVEEGREMYSRYWQSRTEIMRGLPFYRQSNFLFTRYLQNNLGENKTNKQYLYDSEWAIRMSISDDGGNENAYTLCLFYYQDKLIAESLISYEEKTETYFVPIERVSEKSPDGEYIGLDGIEYVNAANDWLRRMEDVSAVKGFGFDGEEYFPVT